MYRLSICFAYTMRYSCLYKGHIGYRHTGHIVHGHEHWTFLN